jgi:hypothetical protein
MLAPNQSARAVKVSTQAVLAAFLLGIGSRLNVQVIGFLPLSELAILLLAPFILPTLTSQKTIKPVKTAVIFATIWLITQVATDLLLQTRFDLAARGAARVIVLLAMIPFFSWFLSTHLVAKIAWITFGAIPGQVLSAYVLRSGTHEARERIYGHVELTWQTHWVLVGNCLVFLSALLIYHRSRIASYLTGVFWGALQIYMGSRSAGAVPLAAVGLTAAYNFFTNRRVLFARVSLTKLLGISVASVIAIGIIYQTYQYTASEGLLGREAQAKYEVQARHKFGLLIGGRTPIIGGLIAISESPLFGYGSWPLDKQRFYLRACELADERPEMSFYKIGYPLIPTHSHVVGSWVEGGLLAALFWFYVLYVCIRTLITPLYHENRLRLWASVAAVLLVWDVLFSPIHGRMNFAMTITVFLLERRSAKLAADEQVRQRSLPKVRLFPRVA